ncbi:MAG: hypothetical protein WAW37_01110 [Syntrophobacteraceae bacterium]
MTTRIFVLVFSLFISSTTFAPYVCVCDALNDNGVSKEAIINTVSVDSGGRCSAIEHIPTDSIVAYRIADAILNTTQIKRSSPLPSIKNIRKIDRQGAWLISEVEFDTLEPAIFLISEEQGAYNVVDIFAGLPDNPEVIGKYFITKNPAVPTDLLICFEPQGPPFDIPLHDVGRQTKD